MSFFNLLALVWSIPFIAVIWFDSSAEPEAKSIEIDSSLNLFNCFFDIFLP